MTNTLNVFGDARVISASELAKSQMGQLKAKGYFKDLGDIWRLGASLGISCRKTLDERKDADTFESINSLDPEGVFAAIMISLHPNLTSKERLSLLAQYAEWGINEIHRKEEIGTLDFSRLGLEDMI